MKKLILTLLMFLLVLSVNACYKTENDLSIKEPDETVFQGITPSRQDHPELNINYSEHDGQHAIRDFTVTSEGNLLLLELSKCIYEYSPQGKLLNIYEYDLEEHGLSAY